MGARKNKPTAQNIKRAWDYILNTIESDRCISGVANFFDCARDASIDEVEGAIDWLLPRAKACERLQRDLDNANQDIKRLLGIINDLRTSGVDVDISRLFRIPKPRKQPHAPDGVHQ